MIKTKFKIGDKVVCVESGDKGAGWKLGFTFNISHAAFRPTGSIYWPMGQGVAGVYENSLALVNQDWDV